VSETIGSEFYHQELLHSYPLPERSIMTQVLYIFSSELVLRCQISPSVHISPSWWPCSSKELISLFHCLF